MTLLSRCSVLSPTLVHTFLLRSSATTVTSVPHQLVLHDTRTRSKRPVWLQSPPFLKWYMCGPTVYSESHIGHAATYVRFDIIRRILSEVFGYRVLAVMCITDIDDKIIKAANSKGISHLQLARHYEEEFFSEMDKLGVTRPSLVLRVTENIERIVAFIQRIIDNNLAYLCEDGSVYFDVSSYGSSYNVFTEKQLSISDSVNVLGKKSPADFALWKGTKPGEPAWPATFRNSAGGLISSSGRPGWHIECSTLSSLAFGNSFDIHSGGEDLIFPHHQNEVCQSVGAGCVSQPADWVGHWLHTGHLSMPSLSTDGDTKMSKSLGNVILISQLLNGQKIGDLEPISPNEFRLLVCLHHYRDRISITSRSVKEVKNVLRRIADFRHTMQSWANGQLSVVSSSSMSSEASLLHRLNDFELAVVKNFSNDIDVPAAVRELELLISYMNKSLNISNSSSGLDITLDRNIPLSYLSSVDNFISVLGLDIGRNRESYGGGDKSVLEDALNAAVSFRASVRQCALQNIKSDSAVSKDVLKQCDTLRSHLSQIGIDVQDTGSGKSSWKFR